MLTVGLCGGSGSGKGAVCDLLREFGASIIDADEIYHGLISSDSVCLAEIAAEFGEHLVRGGTLDRHALAKIVFDPADRDVRLSRLNEITHKHVLAAIRVLLDGYSRDGIAISVVDAPLLFESGFNEECDMVIAVIADRDVRIDRIVKRDNISHREAEQRLMTQLPDDILTERSEYVICNNGSEDSLKREVLLVVNSIKEKYGEF